MYFLGTTRRNFSTALSSSMLSLPYCANCCVRVERRRAVIDVLAWLESHIFPLLTQLMQCGFAGAVVADACC
jgi:hypothetical protein